MKNEQDSSKSLQHRIFREDSKLSSTEISDLLGIIVQLDKVSGEDYNRTQLVSSCNRMFKFALITLTLAAITLLGTMYQLKIGPFYESDVYASTGF